MRFFLNKHKFFIFLVFVFLFLPLFVFTQGENNEEKKVDFSGLEQAAEEGVRGGDNGLSQLNLGNSENSIPILIGRGVNILMQVLGSVALIVFIYGGLMIMISEGQSDKYKKGMNTIWWGALGVVVALSGYAIINFVLQGIATPVSSPSSSNGNTQQVTTCEQRENGQCIDIENCQGITASGSIDEKRNQCDQSNYCQTGLCPDQPSNIVCCTQTK